MKDSKMDDEHPVKTLTEYRAVASLITATSDQQMTQLVPTGPTVYL